MPTRIIRFSENHCAAVEAGTKRRTIRTRRLIRAGDMLRLTGPQWGGNRQLHKTPNRTLLLTKCLYVAPIELVLEPARVAAGWVDGLRIEKIERFARDDGFANSAEMAAYFVKLHGPGKFSGIMIMW